MRDCTVLLVPIRRTVAMPGTLRLTPLGGQFAATTQAILLETLPRDCSRTMSSVHQHLLLPPHPSSVAGTYQEIQAEIMGKEAARGLLCSRFWSLLLGWGWPPIQACCRSFAATRKKRNTIVCLRQVSLAHTVICTRPRAR